VKKQIALLLVLLLTVLILPGAAAEETAALPSVGDQVEGFTVTSVSRFELLGADVVMFEHDKTGAQVMYIANEDTNRTFEITFRTPAENETGVPHVFEHSTLDGSEKYPSKELFFNLSYQTYNTYMNAGTYSIMTTYPVASLSEEQLLKYADYYTDSCFHPLIYTDSSIFDEECWRYALSDADGELTIEGTVYSEMRGAYSLDSASSFNFLKTLFPGSTIGNCFGGNPKYIPEMTNEDLIAYHQEYYHPSNSLTCLYGSFEDYSAFLELLDGYFSDYEEETITIEDAGYTPLTSSVEETYAYGVEAGSDTENGSTIYYGMIIEGAADEEIDQLDLLTVLLSDDSSVLVQNMKEALPTADVSCYMEIAGPESAMVFYSSGLNAEDAELFRKTVDKSLAEVAENGFDSEAVDAIIAALRLDVLLTGESSSIGTDTIPNIAYYWAATGDAFGYMHYIDTLDLFDDYTADGSFCTVISKFLLENSRSALTVTEPVAGLKETEDAELAEKLAAVKAEMTDEEISALLEKSAAEDAEDEESESADTEALVKQLQAVTVASLPEEVRIYDITDSTENGIRYIEAEADADGVGQALLLLDASGLEQNQLHYFKLYTDLLGELDTTAHTRAQLSSQITRYLYDANIRVSAVDDETERGYTPYLRVSFIAMDEDMDEAYSLIHELLFDTKLNDAQSVLDNVSSIKTSLRKSIVNDCYSVQAIRAFASCSNAYAYYNYVNFLDYYAFLCDLENQLAEDPDTVLANLQAVQNALNNSANAIVGFGGSKESAAVHRSAANNFLSSLGNSEIEAQSYSFPEISRREALVVGGSVQYNLIFASYEDLGLEEYSGAMDAVTALVSDTYLYPLLRDQYGAYGVLHYASDSGMYIISYRDPNVAETFDVYASLPELVAELQDIGQETLDGYILSSYSSYALSQGELTGALNAILNTLSGIDQTETLDIMRELKSVTPETIAKYAAVYQALIDNGMISTSGSAAVIEQNADLYDAILDPFANEQSASAALTDVAEGDWCYDAITFMMENDLMAPLSADAFGADSAATMQDLISAMYSIIGGDGNFDDGLATLSAYGIVPANLNAEDVLTIEELACYGNNYCYALGLNAYEGGDTDGAVNFLTECGYLYLTDGTEMTAAATRAQVAYLLTAICSAP
jgi:presequence protease